MNLFTQLPKARILVKSIIRNTWQPEQCFQTSSCTMKQLLTKALRIKHEDYYKRIDNIPNEYEMVYKFPLHYTLNVGKSLTLATTLAIPSMSAFNTFMGYSLSNIEFISSVAVNKYELGWFIFGIAIFNILVYRFCDMTIFRIYRHENSYIAIIPTFIPRHNQQFKFEAGEAKEHFKAISLYRDVTYKVKGKTMLIIPDRFRKANDLFDMLHESDRRKYKFI